MFVSGLVYETSRILGSCHVPDMPMFEAIRACFVEISSARVPHAPARNVTALGASSAASTRTASLPTAVDA